MADRYDGITIGFIMTEKALEESGIMENSKSFEKLYHINFRRDLAYDDTNVTNSLGNTVDVIHTSTDDINSFVFELVAPLTLSESSIDVAVQDQFTDRISLFLAQVLDITTSLNNSAKDDVTVDIETTGVTPAVGNFLCLQEVSKITQVEIIAVTPIAGNQYTLGIAVPLDFAYTTASGCSIQNVDMDVNGSSTPVHFQVGPKNDFRWDITRLIVSMVLTTAGDDGLFGNLGALANGQYFRKENTGTSQNLFNVRENSDFRVESYDIVYPIRSTGGGEFAMASRISFNGLDKNGVVIRLDGLTGDTFKSVIRDNLEGLTKYRVKVQGHVVLD